MRTKTLLLSAALGALSSASLMAQVYSLNAVGYINVSCAGGATGAYTLIANQLNTTNNFISPLLDSQLGTNPSFQGCSIFKYNSTSGYLQWTVTKNAQTAYQAGLVTPPYVEPYSPASIAVVDPATVTLNPGEGIWFFNKNATNVVLTFVGTVLTGETTNTPPNGLTNVLYAAGSINPTGFQIVSSMVPVAGAVDSVLGIAPVKGDNVFIWDTNIVGYDQFTFTPNGWSPAGPPTVGVGQSFWYQPGKNDVGGSNVWVENFAVSQ